MKQRPLAGSPRWRWAVLAAVAVGGVLPAARATDVLLKDGRVLSGKIGMVTNVVEITKSGQQAPPQLLPLILLVDDDLRRTFVPKSQIREVKKDEVGEVKEQFHIHQRPGYSAKVVKSVGPILNSTPFDEFGRRVVTMRTAQGNTDIVQGIVQLTPEWTRIEGITHQWDMRIATNSIPRDQLSKILARQINPQDVEQRKKIARFYIQSERYEDAGKELDQIIADFSADTAIRAQLEPPRRALRQMAAQRWLSELKRRSESGQHVLVRGQLEKFPTEGVSGETLQAVRELLQAAKAQEARRAEILAKFDDLLTKLNDPYAIDQIRPLRRELDAELSPNTLGRMAAFLENVNDAQQNPADRLALAVSGWLLGSDGAVTKLPAALSAFRVRRSIREYVNEPVQLNRLRILTAMNSEEAASPQMASLIVSQMKPPLDTPEQHPQRPGFYTFELPAPDGAPNVQYLVQLPPEYDPLRRYPAIVTLHGAGTSAENQVDWWAGAPGKDGVRLGQAGRNGYIVVAPAWAPEHQLQYQYSAREHAAVLDSLRDACRRFAIDSDRVFLSGHSMGGDAAWDIGLAHPDLWAGVIPIVAKGDRYCALYWHNAQLVPYYFVGGEFDTSRTLNNAPLFDRYCQYRFNLTDVEYLGRGHEDFSDEILRLFDWMGRYHRDFFPREFKCDTLRPWDNFFWWVELIGPPPATMVQPANWPPPRGTQPLQVQAVLRANNTLYVQTGAAQVNVWLSPQLMDFTRKLNISVNGRRMPAGNPAAQPRLQVLLEDVRTRGDRQHPFWAKVEMTTGR